MHKNSISILGLLETFVLFFVTSDRLCNNGLLHQNCNMHCGHQLLCCYQVHTVQDQKVVGKVS